MRSGRQQWSQNSEKRIFANARAKLSKTTRLQRRGHRWAVEWRRARASAFQGAEDANVAVRTSLERKVGPRSQSNGGWMTVPSVDRVVVVTPSAEDPNCAEVLGFASEPSSRPSMRCSPSAREQIPTFLRKLRFSWRLILSGAARQRNEGLKELSKWRRDVPLASVPGQQSSKDGQVFVDRTKREFAQLIGVAEEDVTVNF